MSKFLTIFAGPNGCGKTTVAEVLKRNKAFFAYLNADTIAQGLSLMDSQLSEIQAGRLLLLRLKDALKNGENISFETTLSGRSWMALITEAKSRGYETSIIYTVIESPELAIARVQNRVSLGGHNIPDEIVRRRYYRSLELFASHYKDMVDKWFVFDNSGTAAVLIALSQSGKQQIFEQALYTQYFEAYVR